MAREILKVIKRDLKNYLMNGDMSVSQRDGSITTIGSAKAYNNVDRWFQAHNGDAGVTQGNQSTLPAAFPGSGEVANATRISATGVNAGYQAQIGQRVEAAYAKELVGKKVSLRLYVWSDNLQDLNVSLGFPSSENSWSSIGENSFSSNDFDITPLNDWSVIDITGVNIPVGAENGLEVVLTYTNPVSTGANADVYLTQASMLEGVNVAESVVLFRENSEKDLEEIKRYYQAGGFRATGVSDGTGQLRTDTFSWEVPMSKAPTVTYVDEAQVSGQLTYRESTGARAGFAVSGGISTPYGISLSINSWGTNRAVTLSGSFKAEAEL